MSAYQLFYRTTPVGPDTTDWWNNTPVSQRITLMPPLASAGQTDSTVVTGLSQGTTYYLVLVGLDEAQNASGYSNVASGTTQSCGAPSEVPASFAAAPDTGLIVLSWSAATDPAALSLHLYRATGSSSTFGLIQTLPPSSSSYDDVTVQPGTTYRYRAAWAGPVISGISCEGPSTSIVSATTPGSTSGGTGGATTSATVHAYPNPSSGPVNVVLTIAGTGAQSAHLRIFDMNGHWIATVAEGDYPPGQSALTWDRKGRNGQRVAPGYYELLGTIGGLRVRERLVLLP